MSPSGKWNREAKSSEGSVGQEKERKETREGEFYRLRVIKWKALFITQGTLLSVTW